MEDDKTEEGKMEEGSPSVEAPSSAEAAPSAEAPSSAEATEGAPEARPEGGSEGKTEEGAYQFDDAMTSSEPSQGSSAGGSQTTDQRGGGFAKELFTKTIQAKFRTFYVDLKESVNGKFVKISEKSHGRKSTIMMDAEDVPAMIEALQEVQKQL